MRVVTFRPVRDVDAVEPVRIPRYFEANVQRQPARGAQARGPCVDSPLLNQRRFWILPRYQARTVFGSIDDQRNAGANPIRLGVGWRHRLNMGAHDNLSDLATVVPSRHDVFEEAHAAAPNVTIAAAQLFKPSAQNVVRRKAIENGIVGWINDLRRRRRSRSRLFEYKLARHEMLALVRDVRLRRRIYQ